MKQLNSFFCLALLILLVSISACNTAQKTLYSGDYDLAIGQSIKKLTKKKKKEKHILVLENAYQKANERDLRRINYLKKEGKPANWRKVYALYEQVHYRQRRVKPFIPLFIPSEHRYADLIIEDYSEQRIAAKQNAAEYLYVYAEKLMKSRDKADKRSAYNAWADLEDFYPNFRDSRKNMKVARELGMQHVLIKVVNNTNRILPRTVERELQQLSVGNLDRQWITYHNQTHPSIDFDYDVVINIKGIEISPEAVQENIKRHEKEIKDGWEYVLDENGNVKKDSLGNDIKVDKFITVWADVAELNQHKEARIIGSIDYFDKQTHRFIESVPIGADAIFNHQYASFRGDERALTKQIRKRTTIRPLPFPNDMQMIIDANVSLKEVIREALHDHRNIVMR